MIRIGLLALVAAIVVICVVAAMRPGSFHVARATTIKAAPEKIFPLINDFRSWAAWSPYERLDPAMEKSFGATPAGVGASYAWQGNAKAGAGRMMISKSTPSSLVSIKLDFTAPIRASNTAEFTLAPSADGTLVTWRMFGSSPYLARLVGLFVSMDSLIGGDFEIGLANLKALAER